MAASLALTETCRLFAAAQTRTRRVPQALQDYQVEAVTAGTPEPPAIVSGSAPTATAGEAALTKYACMRQRCL